MMNKRNKILLISFLVVVSVGFIIFGVTLGVFAANNDVAIKNIKMTGIDTGTSGFDDSDGLDYNDSNSYSVIEGYTPGKDNNSKNRIVRSFDELTYHFNFEITGKNPGNDFEERKVNIKITIPEDVAKYVAFDKDSKGGESSRVFTFDGIDTYGSFSKDITIYVLGAPNGTLIKPKFEIQESTNTDPNYVVTLGNVSGDTYNYEYDSESDEKYSTVSNMSGFINYMPTAVSSSTANIEAILSSPTEEFQRATYNNVVGRYLTSVLKLYMSGNEKTGIKGLAAPKDSSLEIPITITNDGGTLAFEDGWTRTYGPDATGDIAAMVFESPYSVSSVESAKKTKFPGNVTLTQKDENNYVLNISDFNLTYKSATINANNTSIPSNYNYIGSYAISVFSGRTKEDGKNDINVRMAVSPSTFIDTNENTVNIKTSESVLTNKYYEVIDYSLIGEFFDMGGNKLSPESNGKGATSKGSNLVYKTTFNYKKTLSDQGLKEIIKVDPNAFRVMQYGDKDINITVESPDGSQLSQDDFEVKFISGDYNNANYVAKNYDDSSLDSRLNSEDTESIKNACATVNKNLSNYSVDQVMNLYGGPCIDANSDFEGSFNKISEAKVDDSEIPITKIVIQTKDGVKLPDSTIVTVEVGLRVRNVSDLTQSYQITALATSSDYDSNVSYYAPRITSDNNSITSPDNYMKTVYAGNDVSSIDTDSPWGDSIKIVNFTSRQTITVTNKNTDGTVKVHYNANKGETINYNVKTNITDDNQNVGADDVWYINNLKIYVKIPKELTYIPDKKLGNPEVSEDGGVTTLVYTMPYTKPNMKISDINFKATVKPNIKGSGVPVTVTSTVVAININNETDTSYFGSLSDSFTIYATGIQNVIVSQKVGSAGSVVEKNSEFSYLLGGYNNTGNNVDNYSIVDILPSSGDKNGSTFEGSYKVKVTLPNSMSKAKVYCSTSPYNTLENEVFNKNNEFNECNIVDEYVDATAIKITGISINADSYMDDIVLSIKPENNNYSDKYINSFVGASETYSQNESNMLETRVVSRNISGMSFVDINENGIKDEGETPIPDMPVTLYKLDNDNNLSKVADSITDENGKYKFKDLEVGRYKIRLDYNSELYDLTLRYATEDVSIDSDAYKISEGLLEISNKRTPDESDGIKVTRDIESVENMDIGLISRKSFGFDISKYITKIDLNYNDIQNTYNYDNQNKVVLSVKNSLRATARVYYGIKIENTSTKAGYVKVINESIPEGLNFNEFDEYNSGWFYQNGELKNVSLENDLINPGETRYLKIVLDMPRQETAKTFINTVTLLDIEEYQPEPLAEDTNAESNLYEVGEELTYAGINWHVVDTENSDDEQILTLLADSGTISSKMGHTSSKDDIYKWSDSLINKYINGDFINKNTLNLPILRDNEVCDDASGLYVASYGGSLSKEGICQSGKFNSYKVRLLTENEYNNLLSKNSEDLSWLYGDSDFWLMNSVFVTQEHNPYGEITDLTNVKNLAKFVSKSSTSVLNGYSSSSKNSWVYSNTKKEVRPVITISNKNIIPE